MDTQLSLFTQQTSSPSEQSSLFVAFRPDEITTHKMVDQCEGLAARYGYLGKTVHRELLHMTLAYINDYEGDIPQRVLKDVTEACAAAAKFPSFPLQLDQVETFGGKPGKRPLVMTMGEAANPMLIEFQQSLMKQLWLSGLPCKKSPKFNPHVTLSRGPLVLAEPADAVSWIAGEIVLLQSIIGEGRHDCLGRWPLEAA